ncbi:peptidylprolyl isomerase [Aquabacter sp. L1I39]|nr:peptidylprolyl isomerase [Aquabacter sp. L1I39]
MFPRPNSSAFASRTVAFAFGLVVALAAFGMPASAQQILVMVNGQPITTVDVAQRAKLHQMIEGKSPGQKQTLEELIDQKIKIQQAAKIGIKLDDEDVDRIFNSVAERSGRTPQQLAQGFSQAGIDPASFKEKLKADNVWQQYVRARAPTVNVRDQDVVAAVQQRGNVQMVATEYKLYPIIFVVPRNSNAYGARLSEANALKARFNGCDAGLETVKGMREVVVRSPVFRLSNEMPPQLRQVLDKTDVGRLTPPEVTQSGVEIFAVCGKTEVKGEVSTKREIKEELASSQFQMESKKLMEQLRKSALIVYR